MRTFILNTLVIFMGIFSTSCDGNAQDIPNSIYDFKVASLEGDTIDFNNFRGKKIMIVNTASKCGLTPQYEALEALYQAHKDSLVIIGFPANNFMWQEPGNDEEIATFCKRNYGVSFPMASKISVKGKDMAAIYKFLTKKKYNNFKDSSVKWNFQKYILNETGQLIGVIAPTTLPDSDEVKQLLQQ